MATRTSSLGSALVILTTLSLALAAPASAQVTYTRLDDGTPGNKQMVADGGVVYVLKQNGTVQVLTQGKWKTLDTAADNEAIDAQASWLWILKKGGSVWRAGGTPGWTKIYPGPDGRQLVACGTTLYLLKKDGTIWHYTSNNWEQKDDQRNNRMISVDTYGNLFTLKESGQIAKYVGRGNWEVVDNGTSVDQIEACDARLYVLKMKSQVWRRSDGQWKQIDSGAGTKLLAADGNLLCLLKDNGNTWAFLQEKWTKVDNGSGTRSIQVNANHLYVLKDTGQIFSVPIYDLIRQLNNAPRVANFNALQQKQ